MLLLGTTSIHWLARPHVFSWIFALIFLVVTTGAVWWHAPVVRLAGPGVPLGKHARQLFARPGHPLYICSDRVDREKEFEIGRILHLKSEIRNLRLDCRSLSAVQFADFGFRI